ncbi:hypothetical protein DLB95_18430 [Salmonella enterica subsp. diarizonae]|uniref:Uncharacterized protein n=1 Tax=Salmonella diarizonae TaxID=59204 RepID=A0A5Y3W733_SALDZ|nr:hypothetical protein [Salmonella enterica subsp. diarizonae]ECJ4379167.1 hypothetical protein [Salmonella enterica subsp. diarizonae]
MKYLPGVFLDLIVAALFAAGIGLNIDGATATAHGFLWLYAVAVILAFLLPDVVKGAEEKYMHRPLLWVIYDLMTDLAIIAVTVWLDWYVLAVFLLFGMGLKQEFFRKQEKRLKEQAA